MIVLPGQRCYAHVSRIDSFLIRLILYSNLYFSGSLSPTCIVSIGLNLLPSILFDSSRSNQAVQICSCFNLPHSISR